MTSDRSADDGIRIEVALPEELLDEIDQYAHSQGTTRSAVVTAALKE